jgi:hypothetical protein
MARHLTQHNHSLPHIKDGLNKKQIAAMAEQSVEHLLEEGNVFQVAEALAAMEEFVKAVRKDERYIQFLRDELAKHHGTFLTGSGAKIEMCEAGVTYDYSQHAEWRQMDEEMKSLAARKKAVEELLRSIRPGKMGIDPETGEVFIGAEKTSKSTYRITLAK